MYLMLEYNSILRNKRLKCYTPEKKQESLSTTAPFSLSGRWPLWNGSGIIQKRNWSNADVWAQPAVQRVANTIHSTNRFPVDHCRQRNCIIHLIECYIARVTTAAPTPTPDRNNRRERLYMCCRLCNPWIGHPWMENNS